MLVPIRCLTCGCAIGDVAEVFAQLRSERMAKVLAEKKVHPDQAPIANIDMDYSDIFDALKIPSPCCRTAISMGMNLHEYM